jgi:transcriptional regulator with XRE-family HTH domain
MQGATIRRKREKLGLSQAQLAQRIGFSAALVSNWENDKSQPSQAQVNALKEAFRDGGEAAVSEPSKDMPWKEAILKVVDGSDAPMHYVDIAQAIIDNRYRVNVGATPAITVSAYLSTSINKDKSKSPFVKVDRGMYALRNAKSVPVTKRIEESDEAKETAREMGLINAFGMFWDRNRVQWKPSMPRLLGVQQSGSEPVNFTEQAGVYVLYDGSRPIYVGKAFERRMGPRLFDHTRDRLTGRWSRFSWFGVRGVRDDGQLTEFPKSELGLSSLIATMEALLIEGLEPPQNRRQGEGFNAVEFMQETDPDIAREQRREVIAQLTKENLS